jgi:hypothetical protein
MEDEAFIRSLERKMGPPLGKLSVHSNYDIADDQ